MTDEFDHPLLPFLGVRTWIGAAIMAGFVVVFVLVGLLAWSSLS